MKSKHPFTRPRNARWKKHYHRHQAPPWWPAEESWPPAPPVWRHDHRKLFPRAVFGVLGALLLSTLLCSGGIFLATALIRGQDLQPLLIKLATGIGAFLLLSSLLFGARALRGFFSPLDTLISASQEVSAGNLDITVPERGLPEMRALIRSFNAMLQQIRNQSQERRDLLADVTHELRTPLTIVQGEIEGMIDGIYPRDDDQLQELLKETQRMSGLIEDLRIMALADRGALPIKSEPTDLSQLTSETMAGYRARAEKAGIHFSLETTEDLPPVMIDPLRFRQVIANLINNAFHHTVRGDQIRIRIRPEGADTIQVEVFDSGSGIDPVDLPHIFTRFFKGKDSEGSGLGLAIAKQLIEAQDGHIHAASEVGQWTSITIELPLT